MGEGRKNRIRIKGSCQPLYAVWTVFLESVSAQYQRINDEAALCVVNLHASCSPRFPHPVCSEALSVSPAD